MSFPPDPFGLSLSKPLPFVFIAEEGEGFDKLSPNGIGWGKLELL